MVLQSNPYIFWQLIPGFILLWIGLYIQGYPRKKRESNIFSIFLFAGAAWAFAGAIQLVLPNFAWQKTWNAIAYIGILVIPTAWFLLSIKITGFSFERIQQFENWLWTIPIITYLILLTNDFHKLFFSAQPMETVAGYASLKNEFGPLFLVHTGYSYILLFAGTIILAISVVRYFPQYGTRAYAIFVGVLSPFIVNIYYIFGDIPPGFPDPTPIAFTVSGIAFAWAIIGGRMLEILPLAHDAIVQNLSTGILVLDSEKNILDINLAAANILGLEDTKDPAQGLSDLVEITPSVTPLAAALDNPNDRIEPLEITFTETGKTFEIEVTSIEDHDKKATGWLIHFSDISQRMVAEAHLASTQETFNTILDTLSDSYFEADPNGVITNANQALIHTLGFEYHADVVGKHFRRFIHPKSILDIYASFKKLYETKLPQKSSEYFYTRRDGDERIAEIAVSPIIKGTEIIGSRGIIRDITVRRRQAARMATLHQVGLATTSSLDMDAILVTIYEQCRQVMSADVFFIALKEEETSKIRYPIFFDQGQRIEPFNVPLGTGLGSWIIQNQHTFLCDDLVAEADQLPIKMRRTGGEPTRSFVGVPLLGRDGAIGALSAQSYGVGAYNEDDAQLLTTIAAQAAAAIENAQLYETEQVAKEKLERQNKEIQEQKDLLDGLLQHSPLAIVINDLDSKITVVNPAFEKLFGYSKGEAIGKNIDDILSTPEIVESMREITRKTLKDEQNAYSEGKRKRKDGTLVDVELFLTPYYIGDCQYGYMVFYNDISERLKAKVERDQTHATYRAVLDTLQDPYFEADQSGKILFANNAYFKNLGYAGKEDIIGKNFRHFTDRKTVRTVFERFQMLFQTKKPIEPFDYYYRKKDGSVQTAEIVVSPVFENDEVVGSRGIIRDISVRIKAEEVLRQAKETAEYRVGELATINRISEVVSHSLDLADILNSACVELTTIFEIRNAGIALLNDDRMSQEIVAFHSAAGEESVLGLLIPLHPNDASSEAMETKKPVVIQDALSDGRVKTTWEIYEKRDTRAIMIVPLLTRGNAIGTIGMPAKDPTHEFSQDEIDLAETIASQIAAAVDNARLYTQIESALDIVEHDLEIGRQIQAGFFPESLPEISGWEIVTHFHAARQVAGDFYDVFQFKNSDFTAFIIADVCDKGVGAALFMVLFRSLLRAFSEIDIDEGNVAKRLTEIVLNTNNFIAEFHGQSNMFATMFFGILNPEDGKLFYINGGHEPPIVMDQTGQQIHRLMPTGPAVGMFEDMDFQVEQIQIRRGDFLFGFTDGATDAKNSAGELFSEESLLKCIQAPWASIFSMIFELRVNLENYIGGQTQFDDITLISFRRKRTPNIERHKIRRPAQLQILADLREFAAAAARQCGLSDEDIFAFKLASEEICTNIIQYGFDGDEPGSIEITFERNDSVATLTITDDGIHFPLDKADIPDTEAPLEDRQLGGLGLFFVKELMDNVSYNKGQMDNNVLVLEKELSMDSQEVK